MTSDHDDFCDPIVICQLIFKAPHLKSKSDFKSEDTMKGFERRKFEKLLKDKYPSIKDMKILICSPKSGYQNTGSMNLLLKKIKEIL